MTEYLDIVDENDNVIGKAEKEEIHAKKLLHRFVHVFVVNDNSEILVQWRAATKKRGPRLYDAAVGGHVDSGESYEQAAMREMKEELGIETPITYVCDIVDRDSEEENMFGKLYITKCEDGFTNWEEEADALDWFTADELDWIIQRLPYLVTGGLKDSFYKFIDAMEQNNNG